MNSHIDLWPRTSGKEVLPALEAHLPSEFRRTGCGVVVCPGGGYGFLASDHEGLDVARWFNSIGVAAFVLSYRHSGTGHKHPIPLQDAQRAVRTARAMGGQWGVLPDRIGIMGFSAGGHLASSAGTHFDGGDPAAADPVARTNSRPDFMILVYPVICFDRPITHVGSQEALLGKDAPADLVASMSSERQVTSQTPPTFLVHGDDDECVASENSVEFYLALRRSRVPAELHIYRRGFHGFGMARKAKDGPVAAWPGVCEAWLADLGMLRQE